MTDTTKDKLWEEMMRASKALKGFPKGPMGMPPDSVKASPEYQVAKRNYEQAFARVRAYNG